MVEEHEQEGEEAETVELRNVESPGLRSGPILGNRRRRSGG